MRVAAKAVSLAVKRRRQRANTPPVDPRAILTRQRSDVVEPEVQKQGQEFAAQSEAAPQTAIISRQQTLIDKLSERVQQIERKATGTAYGFNTRNSSMHH